MRLLRAMMTRTMACVEDWDGVGTMKRLLQHRTDAPIPGTRIRPINWAKVLRDPSVARSCMGERALQCLVRAGCQFTVCFHRIRNLETMHD